MRSSIVGALVLVAGCGGAAHRGASAPPCEEVAQHLVRLAERDNAAVADPDLAAGMRAELARQCEENPWSNERRTCLRSSRTQDETLKCPAS